MSGLLLVDHRRGCVRRRQQVIGINPYWTKWCGLGPRRVWAIPWPAWWTTYDLSPILGYCTPSIGLWGFEKGYVWLLLET